MATLVFTAIGTALGGPFGAAIGAWTGRQIDQLVLPGSAREGPRLTELAVTTSSYGQPIPRHFGRMRVSGTVIWAADLEERRNRQGSKGQTADVVYSYTASFAVALSSRPVAGLGRIWADGKLLRGSAGDLKVAGSLRFHAGHQDQQPDSLIASAHSGSPCPAYRGLAYVVFEDLTLGEFGNRIPALTFEVLADSGALTASMLLETAGPGTESPLSLADFSGLSLEGPPAQLFELLGQVIPISCNVTANGLAIGAGPAAPLTLDAAALTARDGSGSQESGQSGKRLNAAVPPVGLMRYYDTGRDYQTGTQRALVQSGEEQTPSLDLPAALSAEKARKLIERTAAQGLWSRQVLVRRMAELDPDLEPGRSVVLTDRPGLWTVTAWEWRAEGIEVELVRQASPLPSAWDADAGRVADLPDLPAAPSLLRAFELPWNGTDSIADAPIWIAASSAEPGWRGGALFVEQADGTLAELGPAAHSRAIIGTAVTALAPHSPHLPDFSSSLDVELAAADMVLESTSMTAILQGANRALVGNEVIQFGTASRLDARRWRLTRLLRGRGGLESAVADHGIGESFVLLDDQIIRAPQAAFGPGLSGRIAIIGLADDAPVFAQTALAGVLQAPLAPVHGRVSATLDGGILLEWVRRARGAWLWPAGVEVPINEETEAWDIEYASESAILARWTLAVPTLTLDGARWAGLVAAAPQGWFNVRQIGTQARSPALSISPQSLLSGA